MPVTAKDIAEIVGVSRTAVSAVLNGHINKVSKEKREKIFAVANDLRYRPSRAALGLAGKPTRTVTLVFSPHISSIYGELIKQLSFSLRAKGYSCNILLPTDAQDEIEALRECRRQGSDGAIVAYAINDVKNLPNDMPMVCLSPYPGEYEVRVDLQSGFTAAVAHLTEVHKLRRVGMVCPAISAVPLQFEGYKNGLKAAGIKFDKNQVLEVTSHNGDNDFFHDFIIGGNVEGWVITNDLLAARFINFLRSLGREVPRDAAVIAFDGNVWGCELETPLTSLVFPAADIAEKCVAELIHKMQTGDSTLHGVPCLVPPKLFIGGSCGCPAHRRGGLYWSGQPLTLDAAGDDGAMFNPQEKFNFIK